MKKIKYILILLVSVLVVQQTLPAVEVDELLLDTLIKKGTVTPEEGAEIRAESAIQTQEELKAKKKFNVEGKTKIDLSGYVQAQYVIDEASGTADTAKIRRVRLDFRGKIKNVGWRVQTDAYPVRLLDAYLDYPVSFLNLRVGQFKVPFGQENLESSPKLDTIERAQISERLVAGRDLPSASGRDIGLQLSGEYAPQGTKIFDYVVGIFNGQGINTSDADEKKDLVARIVFSPPVELFKGLSLGVAYYNGKWDYERKKTRFVLDDAFSVIDTTVTVTDSLILDDWLTRETRTGLELTYLRGPLLLKGEYITGKDKGTGISGSGTSEKWDSSKERTIERLGWYVQVAYKLKELIPLDWEAVVRYDSYDPDTNLAEGPYKDKNYFTYTIDPKTGKPPIDWTQPGGKGYRGPYDPTRDVYRKDILTVGLNWFLSKEAKIQVNYELREEKEGPKADNNRLITQFQVQF